MTGLPGMAGRPLTECILADHPSGEVPDLDRWHSPLDNLHGVLSRVSRHPAELRDLNALVGLLDQVQPDWIFHLPTHDQAG